MIKYIWEVIFIYSNELVCNILKYINININTEITIINNQSQAIYAVSKLTTNFWLCTHSDITGAYLAGFVP